MSMIERRASNEVKKRVIVNDKITVEKTRQFAGGGKRGKLHKEQEKRQRQEEKRERRHNNGK